MWTILPELAMARLLSSVASGEAIRSADDPRLRPLRAGPPPRPLRGARRAQPPRDARGDDSARAHPGLAHRGTGVPLLLRVRVRRPRRVEAVAAGAHERRRGCPAPRRPIQGLLRRVSVIRPAASSGFWPAIARRQAASSVAPGLIQSECSLRPCLAWRSRPRNSETRPDGSRG